MTYTEYDAVYEIVFWQFFVSLVVAMGGMVHNFSFSNRHILDLVMLPTVVGFFCLCWFTTFMLFVCLDMLMLPPLFSLVRLVSSDALLS